MGELKEEADAIAKWSVGERRAEGEGDLRLRAEEGRTEGRERNGELGRGEGKRAMNDQTSG